MPLAVTMWLLVVIAVVALVGALAAAAAMTCSTAASTAPELFSTWHVAKHDERAAIKSHTNSDVLVTFSLSAHLSHQPRRAVIYSHTAAAG
jgi:hypothetical protein